MQPLFRNEVGDCLAAAAVSSSSATVLKISSLKTTVECCSHGRGLLPFRGNFDRIRPSHIYKDTNRDADHLLAGLHLDCQHRKYDPRDFSQDLNQISIEIEEYLNIAENCFCGLDVLNLADCFKLKYMK